MKNNKKTEEKFSWKKFLRSKLMLLAALVCEVAAYLMAQGVLTGDARLTNGLTVAGAVIVFLYLLKDGISRKYRHYSKKWGMGPYAETAGEAAEGQDNA